MSDYYALWEWQPTENMPDGCNKVVLRNLDGETRELCSCDYWWMKKEDKETYTTFRHSDGFVF
jgi:hypothetical protein